MKVTKSSINLATKCTSELFFVPVRAPYPLLLMPVHVHGGSVPFATPLGLWRAWVIAQNHTFCVWPRGRGFRGDELWPCCTQSLDGCGQQLVITHSHQLPCLRKERRVKAHNLINEKILEKRECYWKMWKVYKQSKRLFPNTPKTGDLMKCNYQFWNVERCESTHRFPVP